MGTRSGNLDPGVVLYLMDELKMDARAIEKLFTSSRACGVFGISSDVRTLLASDEQSAKFAVELSVYRIGRAWVRSPPLGGLDALVFTAGIGEHAAPIRERVCQPPPGSAWNWTPSPMRPVARASARRVARFRPGLFPPTKS